MGTGTWDGVDATVPTLVAPTLRAEVSQIAGAADIFADDNAKVIVTPKKDAPARRFNEEKGVFLAEPQFFQLFDFSMAEGTVASISAPNTVLLTKATADAYYQIVSLQIDPHKAGAITARMENLWGSNFPEYTFEYHFMDQTLDGYYRQEDQLSQLYKIFAGIAIFISCLGLYGLISFMAVRRKKEIGIRKVLGAPVMDILYLLSREFTWLVVVAFLVASPLASYAMDRWLQAYPYHVHLGFWILAATLISSVCISWLTVGYTVVKPDDVSGVWLTHGDKPAKGEHLSDDRTLKKLNARYSILRLLTGFEVAARIAWNPMVTQAIDKAPITAPAKTNQLIVTRYA